MNIPPNLFTTKFSDLLNDPDIDIVIELIGGEHPAFEYIKEALSHGKHVVTANKEVMSKHWSELLSLARQRNVALRYEASVGGGIPLIAPFQEDLIANDISAIYAIVNGTTNYILTQMAREGTDFAVALKQAQELGYAEADPSKDIDGVDAAYKLAILATIAFGTEITPDKVYNEGISRLQSRDFRYAKELGYAIKLLAIAKRIDNSIEARVHPVFIPEDFLLAKVDGVYNAIDVEGDLVGKLIFYGQGAGPSATSSAVVADIVSIAQDINRGTITLPKLPSAKGRTVKPMSEIETRYYMRMSVADKAGVLAQISRVLGDHNISISSVIQKESDPSTQLAEIVIMTHRAKEKAVQQSLEETQHLSVVKEINNFVRVEA
ncbi:MAG: homoserine dehydrogenase, partial [Chloroflexi bacterium]|nr:homoserine dehydrogenase [Chloroflexota bacterium]